MGDTLVMSRKERQRLVELTQVQEGAQSLHQAAARMGLSYRQAKRLWSRFKKDQARGLVHLSRGRPSNRRKPPELRQQSLERYRDQLAGFGPTLASEMLAQRWQIEVDHETLRRWLTAAGLWKPRPRKAKHRTWRARKQHFGEMIQVDGSTHDWFGQGHRDSLLGMIDDATGRRKARLATGETTRDSLLLLRDWIERYGIPKSLYLDRASVYVTRRKPTVEEQLAGQEPATAFGRVCQKLDIKLIVAGSPQAKGRIERSHRVYQDRLVKLIGLEGLESFEQVNVRLESFDEDLNQRFAVEPASSIDVHRPVPADLDLGDVFSVEFTRQVNNDWTVRFENDWYQITGPRSSLPPAKGKVQILRRLDDSLGIHYRGRSVSFDLLPKRPLPVQAPCPTSRPRKHDSEPWRPAPDHPWRQPFSENAPSLQGR